ncbi:YpmS family protein [Terrilactibacillus sp. S3-3]|nr:YpmS family protein [Terrilactibacillus sp. S3-3]
MMRSRLDGKEKSRTPNRWKRAFFFHYLFYWQRRLSFFTACSSAFSQEAGAKNIIHPAREDAAIFTVQAKKKNLQDMINEQIQKYPDSRLSYTAEIDRDLTLTGKLKLLGTGIPFSMSFDPYVSNGDIILKETGVTLGKVSLPEEQVLSFLNSSTQFPKWVIIQPDKRQITINLTQMPLEDQFYLKAKTINLSQDDISFEVHEKQ